MTRRKGEGGTIRSIDVSRTATGSQKWLTHGYHSSFSSNQATRSMRSNIARARIVCVFQCEKWREGVGRVHARDNQVSSLNLSKNVETVSSSVQRSRSSRVLGWHCTSIRLFKSWMTLYRYTSVQSSNFFQVLKDSLPAYIALGTVESWMTLYQHVYRLTMPQIVSSHGWDWNAGRTMRVLRATDCPKCRNSKFSILFVHTSDTSRVPGMVIQ